MTLPQATITGPVRVDSEDPFFVSFMLNYRGDDVVAVLIGDMGRAIHKTLRIGDILTDVRAEFKCGGVMYPHQRQVLVIESMLLPEEAKIGRNLNMWG